VLIDDLCAALGDRLPALQKPHNVHFTDEGSIVLADSVVASIRLALKQPWRPVPKAPSTPVDEFTLASPLEETISREGVYHVLSINLPRPLVFKPGLVIDVRAEVQSALQPSSFRVQITSKDGKMSSFTLAGSEGKKAVAGKLVVPANARPHPSAHNKEPWKEGDLICQLRPCFTFPKPTTSTVRVESLTVKEP
jgi:hypothetical protein